ncbi:MAG: hypothetical protein N2167_11890, partial [Flavobacteriales bacterium]|nr:hypothetical protein [Flavobacteriales bacterium]
AGTAPNNVTPGHYCWDGTRWQRFMDGPRFLSVESTGSIINNATWQILPGASITSTWNAGDIVYINYSGVHAYSSGTGYAWIDTAPFVNGTMIAVGGYTRTEINSTTPWYIPYASIAVYTIPTTGSYTFDIRSIRVGGTLNVMTGGNSTQVTEAILTLTTIRP